MSMIAWENDQGRRQAREQARALSVNLRQVAALLQREDLAPAEGEAHVTSIPEEGLVVVRCNLVLRRGDARDLIDLNEWNPQDEDYLVDVYTRREWRAMRRKAGFIRFSNIVLILALFEAFLYIFNLKGWL